MPKPKIVIVVGESLRKRILADSDLVDQQAAQFGRGRDGALSSWNDSSSMAFATLSINQSNGSDFYPLFVLADSLFAISEIMPKSAGGEMPLMRLLCFAEALDGTAGSAIISHPLIICRMTGIGKDNFHGRLFTDSET